MNLDELRDNVLVRNRVSRNLGIIQSAAQPLDDGQPVVVSVEVRLFWWEARQCWFTERRTWKARNCVVLPETERRTYLSERGPRRTHASQEVN